MAPPASSTLPLGARLKALATTLQFSWFIGHLTLLLSVFRYLLSYVTFNSYSTWAKFSYRLAFVSAAATYGIVVYKGHIARGRLQGPVPALVQRLITDENVQYLGMALVWLFSRQVPLALLPFAVYSVFHVATYSRHYLIPAVQPPAGGAPPSSASPKSPGSPKSPKPGVKHPPLAEAIGRFIKRYYDASMGLVASLEMALLLRLVLSLLTFSKGNFVLLLLYLAFFRARYAQSSFVQQSVRQLTMRVDTSISHQSVPPQVRQGWYTFKDVVRRGYEMTDVSRYGGAAKKPQ